MCARNASSGFSATARDCDCDCDCGAAEEFDPGSSFLTNTSGPAETDTACCCGCCDCDCACVEFDAAADEEDEEDEDEAASPCSSGGNELISASPSSSSSTSRFDRNCFFFSMPADFAFVEDEELVAEGELSGDCCGRLGDGFASGGCSAERDGDAAPVSFGGESPLLLLLLTFELLDADADKAEEEAEALALFADCSCLVPPPGEEIAAAAEDEDEDEDDAEAELADFLSFFASPVLIVALPSSAYFLVMVSSYRVSRNSVSSHSGISISAVQKRTSQEENITRLKVAQAETAQNRTNRLTWWFSSSCRRDRLAVGILLLADSARRQADRADFGDVEASERDLKRARRLRHQLRRELVRFRLARDVRQHDAVVRRGVCRCRG